MEITTVVVQPIRMLIGFIGVLFLQITIQFGKMFDQQGSYEVREIDYHGEARTEVKCTKGIISVLIKHDDAEYVQVLTPPLFTHVPNGAEYRIVKLV